MQLSQPLTIYFPILQHQLQKTAAKFRHLLTLTFYMPMSRSSRSSRNRSKKIPKAQREVTKMYQRKHAGNPAPLQSLARLPAGSLSHCHLYRLKASLLASLGPNEPHLVLLRYMQKEVLLLPPPLSLVHQRPVGNVLSRNWRSTRLLLRRKSSTSSLPGESLDQRSS